MISQTNSAAVHAAYTSKANDAKDVRKNVEVVQEKGTTRVEELKSSIESGEYKVDIQAVSEKMADSLL